MSFISQFARLGLISALIVSIIFSPIWPSTWPNAVNAAYGETNTGPEMGSTEVEPEDHEEAVKAAEKELIDQPLGNPDDLFAKLQPPKPVETASDLITRIDSDFPDLFETKYLVNHLPYFSEAVYAVGDPEESKILKLDMFTQWAYLEVYRAYTLRYLVSTYAQNLALNLEIKDKDLSSSLITAFPIAYFSAYKEAKQERQRAIEWLKQLEANPEERRAYYDHNLGSIEAAYLALAMIRAKQELDRYSYGERSDLFKSVSEEYDLWEASIRTSHSALSMKTFKEAVEEDGDFVEEVAEMRLANERSVNEFKLAFERFIANRSSWQIEDLVQFIQGDSVRHLVRSQVQALSRPSQVAFRNKIRKTFPKAARKAQNNLDETLEEYAKYMYNEDSVLSVIRVNRRPGQNNDAFKQWLTRVFRNTAVHNQIALAFPDLQIAYERLTGFAQELNKEKIHRFQTYMIWSLTLVAVSPMGRAGGNLNKMLSGRLGARIVGAIPEKIFRIPIQFVKRGAEWILARTPRELPLKLLRLAFLGGSSGLVGWLGYRAYGEYLEWQSVSRLSALSSGGMSLTDAQHERVAFKSFFNSAMVAGFGIITKLYTFKNFFGSTRIHKVLDRSLIARSPAPKNIMLRSIVRSWKFDPIKIAALAKNMKKHIRQAFKTLTSDKSLAYRIKHRAGYSALAAAEGATILNQLFVTMIPSSLLGFIRSAASNIVVNVYKGVIFGTVMSLMSVMAYHYIIAAGMKFVVSTMEKMNVKAPTLWLQNAMDTDTRVHRDAFLMILNELTGVIRTATFNSAYEVSAERALMDPNLTAEQRLKLKAAIEGYDKLTKWELLQTIARWHQRIEYRGIYPELFDALGFKMVVRDEDNPDRMTLLLRVGPKLFRFTTTAAFIEQLKVRQELPPLEMSEEEIDAMTRSFEPLAVGFLEDE